MPRKAATTSRASSSSTTASSQADTEKDSHFQIDVLDASREGGGVCHVLFCGTKACAFNNVVNLRVLLGGSQFYLVERLEHASPLAEALVSTPHDAAAEPGSDWFQLCPSDGLPDGCFWVKEGGEYWVAHGDVVKDSDMTISSIDVTEATRTTDKKAKAGHKPVAVSKAAERTRARGPQTEPTVLDMFLADEGEKTSATQTSQNTASSPRTREKRTRTSEGTSTSAEGKDEQDGSPVLTAQPDVSRPAARVKGAKATTKSAKKASASPPHSVTSSKAVGQTPPRAGSDPRRTAEATASASKVLTSEGSDVERSMQRTQQADEAARQFSTAAFLTPPSTPPARARQRSLPPSPSIASKAPAEAPADRAEEAIDAEADADAATTSKKQDKKSKKDKKHKKDKKDKKDKKSRKEGEASHASDADRTPDDEEEDDDARAQRKKDKEKKERKKRQRAAREQTDDGAAEEEDAGGSVHDEAHKRKHHRSEGAEKGLHSGVDGPHISEGGLNADVERAEKKAKKHKKDKKDKNGAGDEEAPQSQRVSTLHGPAVRAAETSHTSPRPRNSPTLRSSPARTPPHHTQAALQPPTSSASTSPLIKFGIPRLAATRSPRQGHQHSPEPLYESAPTPQQRGTRSPGLVLAPSPPLVSPALGFTPVVSALAEEFSLDNQSLSSFSTDSAYLYE